MKTIERISSKQALAIQELGHTIVFGFSWLMSIRGSPSTNYACATQKLHSLVFPM
jgi:hypothetical protein